MAALAGAAIVAGAGSYLASQEQKKATKSANAANQAQTAAAQKQLQGFFQQAQHAQGKGIKAAEAGFADATKSTALIGQSARRHVLRREKAQLARADANMANRGLFNSSAALNARRAVRSDTDLTLAGIDEAVAGLHSTIFRDRARSLGQLHMAQAGLFPTFASQNTSIALANQHAAAPVGAGIAQATGSLAQLLMMYGQQ